MAVLLWFTAGVFALDRAAKLLSLSYLEYGVPLNVLPGLLRLNLTNNTGMALGLLSGQSFLIVLLPILAVGAGALALRRYKLTRFTAIAAGLIVGGFLGNLVDRLFFGFVLDMIYLPFLPFFVCNVADIAITFGVAMMAASLLFRPNDWRLRDGAGTTEQ